MIKDYSEVTATISSDVTDLKELLHERKYHSASALAAHIAERLEKVSDWCVQQVLCNKETDTIADCQKTVDRAKAKYEHKQEDA